MKSEKKTNEQWSKMVVLLREHEARPMWEMASRHVNQRLECWLIEDIPAIFAIYDMGGFDVYTAHQAPREISEIIPWLIKEGQ